MDFIAPPMFDTLNFQIWKVKISMYLKALGIHVYLATIKNSYFVNGKYLEANVKSIHALKSVLNDDYLSRKANIDSAFVVCNTLITLVEQTPYDKESHSDEENDASNICYMIQGNEPLVVNSDSELEEEIPYDDLALLCKMLLKKYDLLKIENEKLKKKNNSLLNKNNSSKLSIDQKKMNF